MENAIPLTENSEYSENLRKRWFYWITQSKVFFIDKKTADLLALTKNTIQFKRLPFNKIFIDTKINLEEIEVFGISLVASKKLEGTKFKIIEDEDYDNFSYFFLYKNKNFPNKLFHEYGVIKTEPELEKKIKDDLKEVASQQEIDFEDIKKLGDNVRIFIMNFLDLLNEPEVEIVSRRPQEERNIKRISRGKHPIPIRNFIVLKGKIKDYIEHLDTGKHWAYSHRFWVRGHFRTYADEKYKKARNLTQWILPYVKGRGLLIDKKYVVKKDG